MPNIKPGDLVRVKEIHPDVPPDRVQWYYNNNIVNGIYKIVGVSDYPKWPFKLNLPVKAPFYGYDLFNTIELELVYESD